MSDIKSQTCCFTGHRIIPLFERNAVEKALEKAVIESIKTAISISEPVVL